MPATLFLKSFKLNLTTYTQSGRDKTLKLNCGNGN